MKAAGAALIFLSVFLCGIFAGKQEKDRLCECEAFLELFIYINNSITHFLMPTKLIYRGFENDILKKTGFLSALCSHEEDEVYFNAWEEAFSECQKNLHLSEKEKELVSGFGACIGKSDEFLQTKKFDYYIKELESDISQLRNETKKNIRVYRTVGFTIGALCAILVL